MSRPAEWRPRASGRIKGSRGTVSSGRTLLVLPKPGHCALAAGGGPRWRAVAVSPGSRGAGPLRGAGSPGLDDGLGDVSRTRAAEVCAGPRGGFGGPASTGGPHRGRRKLCPTPCPPVSAHALHVPVAQASVSVTGGWRTHYFLEPGVSQGPAEATAPLTRGGGCTLNCSWPGVAVGTSPHCPLLEEADAGGD